MSFLAVKKEELNGVQPDFIYVTGEAYCDHPSFGTAIITRMLEHEGFLVAVIPQPQKDSDYTEFGCPKYGFFVSSGVVDSMVNNYTVAKIPRTRDVYSEGGDVGKRPDRAVTVYTKAIKKLFPNVPVVIGGIEASLRRFAHYDYWADKVLPSILVDSGADLLIYGMGETPILDIASRIKKGIPLDKMRDIEGICYLESFEKLSKKLRSQIEEHSALFCPSFEEVVESKRSYVKAFNMQSQNNDHLTGKVLLQKQMDGKYLVQNIPQRPCSVEEMDMVYSLPYERTYHPMYIRGVPAIEEVKFSVTSQRGCFGGCSYCAITYHQGRIIQKRSKQSIIREVKIFTKDKDFKGYVHDVGGPTANFRNTACKYQKKSGVCLKKNCIGYKPCANLEVSHTEYLDLLRELRELEGVKKVFIRSGIRYDYLMMDDNDEFLVELIKHHVSGQLKVAPEHTEDSVLKLMNKPPFRVYKEFKAKYDSINQRLGKKQYLVPYLISSHPGCTIADAVRLAEYLKSINYMPEQVQDFYPTPSTKSTCMYYTGLNPDTMEEIFVPKSKQEKRMQRALLQYRKKENYDIVHKALEFAGRKDLIGFGANCLIKPTKEEAIKNSLSKSANVKNAVKPRNNNSNGKNVFFNNNKNSSRKGKKK